MRTMCCAAGVLLSASVLAQPVHLLTDALPTPVQGDGCSGDNFGIAMAVSGNYAVIGAYGDTVVAPQVQFGIAQGSAYVFERIGDNWVVAQKLSPEPIGGDGDNFGVSISMSDDLLAIGAPRRTQDGELESGTVFIYGRSAGGYLLRQILNSELAATGQRFGTAVALWQDQLAVGVPGSGNGRVDLYRRDGFGTYVFQRSLAPEPTATEARFGTALALADGQLLIGAPAAEGAGAVFRSVYSLAGWSDAERLRLSATPGMELGAALAIAQGVALVGAPGAGAGEVRMLISDAGSWVRTGVLVAADGVAGDRFGSAIAVDAGRAAIAAPAALFSEGKTYLYARSGAEFSSMGALDIADGGAAKRFGGSLALAADGVLIGADLDRVGPNPSQGSARWFRPSGGSYVQLAKLDSGNGAIYDRYGTSVAVDGDFALVGAYLEDTAVGGDAGAAHWFRRVDRQWVYGGQLLAPDAEIEDRFGIAVDIDGDRMAVGAVWDVVGTNVDQGSAYIYHRQGADWVFEAKLVASDGAAGDYFGYALSLDGDRLLVGARGVSVPVVDQGRAYVFVRGESGWTQEARLPFAGINPQAYFGTSVALAGELALVGAPGTRVGAGPQAAGAAVVFRRQGASWTQTAILQAPQPQANGAYGYAVAADSERLLVGAFLDGFLGRGAAYVYRSADLVLDGELRASQVQPGEGLGIAVAISGTTAVLGASGYDLPGKVGVGTVRIFERGAQGWQEDQQWFAADAADGDGFGGAVALDGVHAVIGAPGKGIENPLEGVAYVSKINALFADGFE
ncbi:MAG: hypothetical protein IPO66_22580 [Rhodanobacteraceae bacterium]|nr:hypothetical protein [Rhodanobacteraceae bacterium]